MELRDYLRILRAHWLAVMALTLLGVAVAWGWTALQPKVYTADASGIVTATNAGSDTGASLVGDQLARSKVTSYVELGSWRAVAECAIDELGLSTTPESLVTRVDVSNPLDTVIVRVTASASSPEEARDLAESWLGCMVEQIDNVEGTDETGTAAVTLVTGDSARLPTAPSSPNVRLALALGALVGLALGIGYAVVRHVIDRRLRDPRDIERETGVPVVGTLPVDKGLSVERGLADFESQHSSSAPLAEAMRELRTNLQFMDVDNPPRAIVVTSPLPGDGKSTMAANLAVSIAAAGRHVVLLDADLRRPMVSTVFGLPDGAGVTDVLAGRAELNEVVHNVGTSRNLAVITAGRIPPNPSEVLGSNRMQALLQSLTEHALVIIDSPPLLPVTDAAVLTTAADGALIVVSAGKTTYDMLHKALANLGKANARVLGVVLNRVPRKNGGYYGYQYEGDYAAADTR